MKTKTRQDGAAMVTSAHATRRRIWMRALGALLLPLALGACGGGDECIAGTACKCSGDSCDQVCGNDGRACSFECTDGADCTDHCPGGACGATANGATSMVLSCAGNNCSLECFNTPVCEITDCTVGCALKCHGAATCQNSCTPLTGGCGTTP